MRTPFVAGNWKMNTTLEEATALVQEMRPGLGAVEGIDKALCPPFISLAAVGKLVQGTTIKVGAQNMYAEEKGAFTGEISPLMLKGLCEHVILGHSERRHIFGESDSMVNRKVKAALTAGLKPILCVGERLEENEAGRTEEVVSRQLLTGLEGIGFTPDIVVAYEPVWAIGTGKAATSAQAQNTIALIRRKLAGVYGQSGADQVRILYGGSVTSANVAELSAQPDIDGALVGGASLKAKEFISIVEQTAKTRQ